VRRKAEDGRSHENPGRAVAANASAHGICRIRLHDATTRAAEAGFSTVSLDARKRQSLSTEQYKLIVCGVP
jgi:hypothetical protein